QSRSPRWGAPASYPSPPQPRDYLSRQLALPDVPAPPSRTSSAFLAAPPATGHLAYAGSASRRQVSQPPPPAPRLSLLFSGRTTHRSMRSGPATQHTQPPPSPCPASTSATTSARTLVSPRTRSTAPQGSPTR